MGKAMQEGNNPQDEPGLHPGEGTQETDQTDKPWTPAGGPDEQFKPATGSGLDKIEEGHDPDDDTDVDERESGREN